MREVEGGRGSAQVQVQFDFKSPEEKGFYYETLQALQNEGGKSREEIELLLQEAVAEWRRYDE